MSYFGMKDLALEIATGLVPNHLAITVLGRAPSGVQTTATDIWDRADATATQQIWIPPTQARLHDIVSTSANDDGNPAGTGAQVVRVYGLVDWDTKEVYEDVTMNGLTPVATVNSYVIINFMEVRLYGTGGVNIGTITATAQVDGTVSTQINAVGGGGNGGVGMVQMAIRGIPSVQDAYLTSYSASLHDQVSPATPTEVDLSLLINYVPQLQTTYYIQVGLIGLMSSGTSSFQNIFNPYFRIPGPAIIKAQAFGSAADLDVSAGFTLILVDN